MPYHNIREEELKNTIARDYFPHFDTTKIIGNIDFCITYQSLFQDGNISHTEIQSLLWAEAKKGKSDILKSIVQLILTIGKARTFNNFLPPAYLGAFDADNIAFVPYHTVSGIFTQNDFNWNVAPSNHDTREFKLVMDTVKSTIDNESSLFNYATDDQEIREFIKTNFVVGNTINSKIKIDKSNFLTIYNKWLLTVKPSIIIPWESAKTIGIIDADFYLADLLSDNNHSLKDTLFVILRNNRYEFDKKVDEIGLFSNKSAFFTDNQKAHQQFWNKYDRPPREEYWDYIVTRRDILLPQDVRERKGSFFTPQIWVEKSQEYLTAVLGENWQDEYYIWDCASGTGNLLAGLINRYNIFASTLDQADVDAMQDRIKNGANLADVNCFQFDFLNDELTKLPPKLQDIIADPIKRQKLLIYINPPYAEAGDSKQRTGTGKNKNLVSTKNKTYLKYKDKIGKASNELFAQFFTRIYSEFPDCIMASFSTLKHIKGSNFIKFREYFLAEFKKGFVIPADTFDNVRGQFPIGFTIWDTSKKQKIKDLKVDVFSSKNQLIGTKDFYSYAPEQAKIGKWINSFNSKHNSIGMMNTGRNDFQNRNLVHIRNQTTDKGHSVHITKKNLIQVCMFLGVRWVFKATWLNDRDQFLYPNNGWQKDKEFQNNCLAYTLFHSQNRITSKDGVNHWIPFTEYQVNSSGGFDSNWMANYINGKLKNDDIDNSLDGLKTPKIQLTKLEFSPEAQAVFESGLELWRYYHSLSSLPLYRYQNIQVFNIDASLYDIKEYFQGRNNGGKMNSKSVDEEYNRLITNLSNSLEILSLKIQPKVYEYEFLK